MGALIFPESHLHGDDDLSRFVRREQSQSSFGIAVRGAHCANCIAKIESGVRGISGVANARLNLSTGKLEVTWKGDAVSAAQVIARVRALGYDAQPFDAAQSQDADAGEQTFLLRCLAVAGFGTVFVMGLTDAVWYGGAEMSAATRNLFFWLAGAVSLPVTLFASQPFFRSAFQSLAKRQTNMDVPISLAIALSLGLSLYQTMVHGTQIYFDAAVMLAFLLLIGRYLDFLLRDRARGAARQLLAMQAEPARRFKPNGNLETVAAREIVPGDRVFLTSGERVPADGTLEDKDCLIDVSLVTGETEPVAISHGGALHAGTIILGKPVTLAVAARVEDSLVADLARLLEAGQQTRSLYVRLADRAARAYVPFVTALAALVFASWLWTGATFVTALTGAITVLVITCPCALGLAVPAVQIVATGRLFRRGIFVKSGDALERLAEIDTAVFDKTGTLTWGTPQLVNSDQIPRDILDAAASLARASRHPLARALAAFAGEGPVAQGVRETAGAGLEADMHGMTLKLGSARWCGLDVRGSTSELWFRPGHEAPVRLEFRDRMRPDTAAMLAALRERGIDVEMLTGDREAPAAEIAAEADITQWQAAADPKTKAARMQTLRAQGRRALMVGDGLNDAAALALAHVSIAPGSAVDVSQLAADMVLRGDSLMPIVEAVDVARKARSLVLENFGMAAIYNLIAIPVAALGFVSPLIAAASMAASSLVVTLNALRLARGGQR
ncbi:MAG TPA: heavy metal translocating P-type ATPase [Rhizomicrobium sp.]|nr:heavy metal translocating P-type ATPase [Rhizomicrobium sp.]